MASISISIEIQLNTDSQLFQKNSLELGKITNSVINKIRKDMPNPNVCNVRHTLWDSNGIPIGYIKLNKTNEY